MYHQRNYKYSTLGFSLYLHHLLEDIGLYSYYRRFGLCAGDGLLGILWIGMTATYSLWHLLEIVAFQA